MVFSAFCLLVISWSYLFAKINTTGKHFHQFQHRMSADHSLWKDGSFSSAAQGNGELLLVGGESSPHLGTNMRLRTPFPALPLNLRKGNIFPNIEQSNRLIVSGGNGGRGVGMIADTITAMG